VNGLMRNRGGLKTLELRKRFAKDPVLIV